jgi:hypothetical protein
VPKRSDMRELVRRLDDIFTALGYKTIPQEHRLTVEDTALLSSSQQVIVAGHASYVTDEEITYQPPRFIVIEDDPPARHVQRLLATCRTCRAEPSLVSFSRFIDPLWQAAQAATSAQADSQAAGDLDIQTGLSERERPNPLALYTDQLLRVGEDSTKPQSALIYCDTWLESGTGNLVVLAPAGLGKSELATVVEWKAALDYLNRSGREGYDALPPVALRVQLRELPALSLEAISQYLRNSRGLERVRNPEVLVQLLLHHRLVLLLDGLDELSIPRPRMEEGLEEIDFFAQQGARIMLTSRSGYYGSEGVIGSKLGRESIATLQPLDEDRGRDLLTKRGASKVEAEQASSSLPTELREVPLFLIWAWRSGFGAESQEKAQSRARMLLEFVRLFCIRDEPRIRVPADEQVKVLTDLAYQSTYVESVSKADFMYLVGAENSPFVEGPHALLRLRDDTNIVFRDATFESLFLAHGVSEHWSERAAAGELALKTWLGERFGEVKLESLTVDYLGELLPQEDVRVAWRVASEAPTRYQPFARRNLLAVAIAKLRESGEGKSEQERAKLLEEFLGSRDLSDTVLLDLVFEMLDFKGWRFRGCDGRGAYVAFCHFEGADIDTGLDGADMVSSTGLEPRVREEDILRKGTTRLARVMGPWRNHALGPYALKSRLGEDTRGLDVDGMRVLRAGRLATLEQAERGLKYWGLTEEARRRFRGFLENPAVTPPELRDLLLDLGRM